MTPLKAKVMIRTSGECWLTCGESCHPALEDAPQFIEGRMSLIKAGYLPDESCGSSTPSWWDRDTPPTDVELEEFLRKANVYFDGAPLDEEDKEDILTYLRVKWEREKRKREKKEKK